jgi:hypothetical protein
MIGCAAEIDGRSLEAGEGRSRSLDFYSPPPIFLGTKEGGTEGGTEGGRGDIHKLKKKTAINTYTNGRSSFVQTVSVALHRMSRRNA